MSSPLPYSPEELAEWPVDQLQELVPNRLIATSPAQVARFLDRLEIDERRTVLRPLPADAATEILAEMDDESAAEVFGAMREARAVALLEELDPDDAADVVAQLDDDDRTRLLEKLEPETAAAVRQLLDYPEDSAGGMMTTELATVNSGATVQEVIDSIRSLGDELEGYSFVYVVDVQRRLLGVVSLRHLIMARPEQRIDEVMVTRLLGVLRPEMDQEQVAHEMAETNLPALPVVDADGRLLGRITHDDVIDVMREEATEDIHLLSGAGKDESIDDALSFGMRRRLPWLVVNLGTAYIAASVIMAFEDGIGRLPLLAAFMPIVAGIGGNTGQQTLAVAIRSMALGELPHGRDLRICVHQSALALFNGLVIGLLAGCLAGALTKRLDFALVVVAAMVLNMGLAGLTGAFIPLVLRRLGLDPAQSSTVFLTGTTDTAGFFLVLALGVWFIQ